METKELFNTIVREDSITDTGKVFLSLIDGKKLGFRELYLISSWIKDYLRMWNNDEDELLNQLETHYSL